MTKKDIVRYSNYIVRASQRLTLTEQRIIFSAISKIPSEKEILPTDTFYVSVNEYAALSEEQDLSNAYDALREGAKSLLHRFVTLAEQDQEGKELGEIEFNWLSASRYRKKTGVIGICFNPFMIPYINLLRGQFTAYNLKEIAGFRSVYTQPLYVQLMQYMRDVKTTQLKQSWVDYIELDALRTLLDATKYERYADFKRKVLEVAVRQINESKHTKFTVKWEPHEKKGKKIVSIKFSMRLRPQVLDYPEGDEKDVMSLFDELTPRQATLSERQIGMYADWLSGYSVPAEKIRQAQNIKIDMDKHVSLFISYLQGEKLPDGKKMLEPYEANDVESYRNKLVQYLANPDFVLKIYEQFLKPLGFRPAKATF